MPTRRIGLEERFVLSRYHVLGNLIVFPCEEEVKTHGVVHGPLRVTPVVGDLNNHCTLKHFRKRCRRALETMDLPDDGVKFLGDESKLGSISRRGGGMPIPQTFEAVFVLEGHPGGSPGGAIDPETTWGATVPVGVILTTDEIRAKFAYRYAHAGERSESGYEFGFPLKLCKSGCK